MQDFARIKKLTREIKEKEEKTLKYLKGQCEGFPTDSVWDDEWEELADRAIDIETRDDVQLLCRAYMQEIKAAVTPINHRNLPYVIAVLGALRDALIRYGCPSADAKLDERVTGMFDLRTVALSVLRASFE